MKFGVQLALPSSVASVTFVKVHDQQCVKCACLCGVGPTAGQGSIEAVPAQVHSHKLQQGRQSKYNCTTLLQQQSLSFVYSTESVSPEQGIVFVVQCACTVQQQKPCASRIECC